MKYKTCPSCHAHVPITAFVVAMYRGGAEGVRCRRCQKVVVDVSRLYSVITGVTPIVFVGLLLLIDRYFSPPFFVLAILTVLISLPMTILIVYFVTSLKVVDSDCGRGN